MAAAPVVVNCTVDNQQLAELRFTDLGDGSWSAQVAVGTDSEVLLYQRGIPAYPDDLNVLGLILSVISRLPAEAFEGPVVSRAGRTHRRYLQLPSFNWSKGSR